jgi:hypothetical protein
VFVGSILAAGVGITLTAASVVIFAELDWTPGNMRQAEDRCHRIGQHDNVFAKYIVYSGSLDALMSKVLRKKEIYIAKILGDAPPTRPQSQMQPVDVVNKRRGRPKVYVDQPPPTTTERSKRSVKKLKAAGGKRIMLRLTPEGYDALRTIMEIAGIKKETGAINQILVARKKELMCMHTNIKQEK